MGSERGASLPHPHPQSDTPGARRERGGGAEPQTTKSRSRERQPLPREVGGRGRPALWTPLEGPRHLLPSRPLGWGARDSETFARKRGTDLEAVGGETNGMLRRPLYSRKEGWRCFSAPSTSLPSCHRRCRGALSHRYTHHEEVRGEWSQVAFPVLWPLMLGDSLSQGCSQGTLDG